ncbi:MAG: DNA-binding transcriptional regulator [Actinobacteria bacterium]|nr:DNA-binding transcriptional regulator [Actinomycetota bacterium]
MTSGKVSPATDEGLTARRFDDLAEALVGVRSAEQMKSVLRDLCTVAELDAMGQRLQVAGLVNEGVSYQEISRQTGASTATVTRVAHWLRYGEGGYLAILKKVRK